MWFTKGKLTVDMNQHTKHQVDPMVIQEKMKIKREEENRRRVAL